MPPAGPGNSAVDPVRLLEECLSRMSYSGGMRPDPSRRMMEGERRRVAALFLDISGFTSLSEYMDHELLHSIAGKIMTFLSRIVDSHGGYVDKIEGDRLMALFGAKEAAENDSARAVDCAMAMQRALNEIGPVLPSGGSISARAGIDFGDVTVAPDPTGHLTAMGVTVNIASRLEELARPGMVLVTGSVRKECGELFRFEDMGRMDIRGITEPVPVYRPTGPGSLQHERWQRAAALQNSPMVGRDGQLRKLGDVLEECARDGCRSSIVRITGEAGIGKSRLLHEFIASVSGFRVLHGHSRPHGKSPFGIWIDLFRDHLGLKGAGSNEIASVLEGVSRGSELPDAGIRMARMIPVLTKLLSKESSGPAALDTTEDRTAALRLLLDSLCIPGGTLIALEDVHWMDDQSLGVLELFLRNFQGRGVMLVTTERPFELPDTSVLQEGEKLTLSPLEKADIQSLAGFILSEEGGSVQDELLELVTRGARGNPFFAEELVLSLIETGGINLGGSSVWSLTGDRSRLNIPSSIRAILQTRIDRLPPDEKKLLQIASVIGTDISLRVLENVMDELETSLQPALQGLIQKGFLTPGSDDGVSFRHDLLQSTVYGLCLKHNRRILHGIIAGCMEAFYPPDISPMAPVIFQHWKRSNNRDRTLKWSRWALLSAEQNEQNRRLMKLADEIIGMVDPDRSREEFVVRLYALMSKQKILGRFGRLEEAMELVEEVLEGTLEVDEPALRAEALRSKCIIHYDLGRTGKLDDLFSEALECASRVDDVSLKPLILGARANYYSDIGRAEDALKSYREALELDRRNDLRRAAATVQANMANLLMHLGRSDEAEELYLRSVEASRDLGIRTTLAYSLNGYAIFLATRGKLNEAEELFTEGLECQEDLGNMNLQSSILNNLGVLTRMQGRLRDSLEYRQRALNMAEKYGSRRSHCIALINLGNIRRILKDYAMALEHVRRATEMALEINDAVSQCHALSIESMTLLAMEEYEGAEAAYEQALALVEEKEFRKGMVEDFDELVEMVRRRLPRCRIPTGWEEASDSD